MKEEMNMEDFEQFLKRQADKYRMYPNSQLWRNINQQLHGNTQWPALTFAAILTGALLTAALILFHPHKNIFKTQIVTSSKQAAISSNKMIPFTIGSSDSIMLKPIDNTTTVYSFDNPSTEREASLTQSQFPVQIAETETGSLNNPIINKKNISTNNSDGIVPDLKNNNVVEDYIDPLMIFSEQRLNISKNNVWSEDTNKKLTKNAFSEKKDEPQLNAAIINIDNPKQEQVESEKNYKKKRINHLKMLMYGGSSISYRILSEPQSYNDHFPYNPVLTGNPRSGVNNAVKQRPSVGFELGTAISYGLNNWLSVKVGLQFNYRQFSSNVYFSPLAERSVLLLNNSDTSYTYSNIRNGFNSKQSPLRNTYYQIALPIGFDWTFAESRMVKLSLGASFQPTYQLNTNVYMITSDYKSYTQQPNLVRRWNFNTSAELMANFTVGNLQWQVGPQVRYQLLPTQIKNYSIHEHLIDYGLKVQVVKQLK